MYPNDNVEYAAGRLVETIIRYKGEAVNVMDVKLSSYEEPLYVKAYNILTTSIVEDKIDEFDLTPVKLGFVNFEHLHNVAYYERKPMRQDWRQGLRKNNSCIAWGVQQWRDDCIAKTINGLFPSVADILVDLRGQEQLRAWHRDFCVNGTKQIFYRFYGKIGDFVDRDGKEFLLDEKFFWVEESLREAL